MSEKNIENKLYNSGPTFSFIKMIKRDYKYVNIHDLLKQSNITYEEAADPNHWFTQEQVNKFYETCVTLTGDKEISKKAGRFALESESLGVFKRYILSLGNTATAYKMSSFFAKYLDKSADYESIIIDKNKVRIIANAKEGVQQEPFQCENRIGNMEYVPELFGCKLLEIEHPKCMFKNGGGKICEYIVKWQNTKVSKWKDIKRYATYFIIPIYLLLSTIPYINNQIYIYFLPALIFSLIGWFTEYQEKEQKQKELNSFNDLYKNYINIMDKGDSEYGLSNIIKKISEVVNTKQKNNEKFDTIIRIIKENTNYDYGIIFKSNRNVLNYHRSFGFLQNEQNFLGDLNYKLTSPDALKNPFVLSFLKKQPVVENNIVDFSKLSIEKNIQNILKCSSYISCPIIHNNNSVGIITIFNKETTRIFTQKDINIIMGIAPSIGNVII